MRRNEEFIVDLFEEQVLRVFAKPFNQWNSVTQVTEIIILFIQERDEEDVSLKKALFSCHISGARASSTRTRAPRLHSTRSVFIVELLRTTFTEVIESHTEVLSVDWD